jgi:glycosyltransferase involved in cell wall biosynthesis
VDEDYGFATVEALMSGRPVVTTEDAGGVLEFVTAGSDGWVTPPTPDALAEALAEAFDDAARCRTLGQAGRERVRSIRWETVIEQLTA